MSLNAKYYAGSELEDLFVNKTTGTLLAGGKVNFWQDNNRTIPKLVYTLTDQPPYNQANSYSALPNPIILSSIGTFQDAMGNNVAVYYYPFDEFGNLQLYYVTVTDAYGNEQFTREAWPTQAFIDSAIVDLNVPQAFTNLLSNPTFAVVSFVPSTSLVIPFSGSGSMSVGIAPDWTLNITYTGTGTVDVARTSIAGSSAYPFNPPYTLTITPGANVSALSLTQQLLHNPSIWSPQPGGTNGWIAASILLAPNSSVTMQYVPSQGAAQTILQTLNSSGAYAQFNSTTQLSTAANTDTSDVGFVNINLVLSTSNATTLSNVQALGVQSDIEVTYNETPVNTQIANLVNYVDPQLAFKPIDSYLIGWDFPYNPAQFLGASVAASTAGANTSQYIWDQTILFQSVNSGAAASRAASGSGALRITATNATQFALVQYLSQTDARKILNNPLAVNLSALTNVVAGVGGTISLWYTTGSLPSTASHNSIVATLSAAGKPATFNGTWTEVPRSNLGDATFTVLPSSTTNFNNYGFSGWNLNGAAGANTATFFAIVVGFATLPIGDTLDINSISLVPGSIPTLPAPKTGMEIVRQCQTFYSKSFELGTVPATGVLTGETGWAGFVVIVGDQHVSPQIRYPVTMRAIPTLTFYNPVSNNALAYDFSSSADCGTTTFQGLSSSGFNVTVTSNASMANGDTLIINWTADARLGL